MPAPLLATNKANKIFAKRPAAVVGLFLLPNRA
jgi:hypothetical protein